MMKQNHFSSIYFFYEETQQQFIHSYLYVISWLCLIIQKEQGSLVFYISIHVILSCLLSGEACQNQQWSNLFACSVFDCLHVLFPPIINYNAQ